jgi:hypothetical protein
MPLDHHQEVLVVVALVLLKLVLQQLVQMEQQTLAVAVVEQAQEAVQVKVQECKVELVAVE